MRKLIIAIDGPSGAGKGTVAREVASRLGYRHVDSGAMYRAVAWKALRDGIGLENEAAVAAVAARSRIDIGSMAVLIDGVDVTREIRTPEIDRAAASVARLPSVRTILVSRQREMGDAGGVVMEGRDIGTVVFPAADVKLYLDAAAEERARRRVNDAAHTGVPQGVAEVASLLSERDRLDSTRTTSPLYAAPDAVVIDTTGRSIDDVVERVMEIVSRTLVAQAGASR